jgi:uncharacterized membrane protein YbhN (UPF0104 family)
VTTPDKDVPVPPTLEQTAALVAADEVSPPKPAQLRNAVLRTLLLIGLLAGLFFFARSINLKALTAALGSADFLMLGAAIALNFGNAFCKAVYWSLAVAPETPVPILPMFRVGLAAQVASLLAPARAGDAFRVWQLKRLFHVEVPISLVVTAVEKIGDIASLLVLCTPIFWLLPGLPARVHQGLLVLPGGLIAIALVGTYVVRHPKLEGSRWLSGLALFERPKAVAWGGFFIFVAWALDLVEIRCCMASIGAEGGFPVALLALLLVNLAVALPISPGNAGTHELGGTLALTLAGASKEQAVAFALLYHAVQTIPLVLAGFLDARALLAGKARFGRTGPPPTAAAR